MTAATRLRQLNQRLRRVRDHLSKRDQLTQRLAETQNALSVAQQRLRLLHEAVEAQRAELERPEPGGLNGKLQDLLGRQRRRELMQQRFDSLKNHYEAGRQKAGTLQQQARKLEATLQQLDDMETEQALILAAKTEAITEAGGEQAKRLKSVAEELAHAWADLRALGEAITMAHHVRELLNGCVAALNRAGEAASGSASPPTAAPAANDGHQAASAKGNGNGHAAGHGNGNGNGNGKAATNHTLSCLRLEEALREIRRAWQHLQVLDEQLGELNEPRLELGAFELFCEFAEHFFKGRIGEWAMREKVLVSLDAAVSMGTRVDQLASHLIRRREGVQMRADRLAATRHELIDSA